MIALSDIKTLKGGVWGICPMCGDSQFVHKRYDIEPNKIRCDNCANISNADGWKTEIGPAHWAVEDPPHKIAACGNVVIFYHAYMLSAINPTHEEIFDWINKIYNPYQNENCFYEGIKRETGNRYSVIMGRA